MNEPVVVISRDAAIAAIGALSILERAGKLDAQTKACMQEIMDALMRSGANPS
jgi:hypothetical protein